MTPLEIAKREVRELARIAPRSHMHIAAIKRLEEIEAEERNQHH